MSVEPLVAMFSKGEPSLELALADADARAGELQRKYRRVVQLAVWGGFFALVSAFAAISFGPNAWFVLLEAISFAAMVWGVTEGLVRRHHQHWILARHTAERLRLARFGWLVNPQHWDLGLDALQRLEPVLQMIVDDIRLTGETEMKRWCRDSPRPSADLPARSVSPAFVEAVKQHYVPRRLNDQLGYFIEMAERRERLDAITRILPALGFGAAVLLSFVHLVGEVVDRIAGPAGSEGITVPGGWMLFLILVLPAAGAAARLLRSAFEFARNRQRFVTAAAELERARGRLDVAAEPGDVARAMGRAEDALEQEHREWLELMLEAEWFG